MVARLIAAGAAVDTATMGKEPSGWNAAPARATPLLAAAEKGHEAVMTRLIAAGADVNKAWTNDGATPLYMAAWRGHDAVVARLIAAGAGANKANLKGVTPLSIATERGHEAVVAQL